MNTIFLICLALAPLAQAQAQGAQGVESWQAGLARVVVTPTEPMWLSGYGARTKPAEGKVHDLCAKALALRTPDGACCVLVALDLVGIDRDLAASICAEIEKRHKLPRAAVRLSVSHTHCGPVVGRNLQPMYFLDAVQQERVSAYTQELEKKIVDLVDAAFADLKPAGLAHGNGLATFATNRRTNKEADVPKLRDLGQLKGPVDHDVPVLAIRTPEGKVRAIVFGYACHATVLNFYHWCGDYPGFAQRELERLYPDATALFWAGCGGDQNPLPRRSVDLAEAYGRQLARSVDAAMKAPMTSVAPRLAMKYAEIDLPLAELPSRETLVQDVAGKDKFIASRAKLLLKKLEAEGSLRQKYPYPVQTWQLGTELTWVALGGEVVVDYSLRLKKELGPIWVAGYSNDVMAYIPSLRVLTEGGYEGGGAMVYYGLPAVWSPRVEELIVAAVHEQARALRAAPPSVNQPR
jgi:neutral ceramidase